MTDAVVLVLGGVGLAVGLFGTLVPVVPGLLLVLVAALASLLVTGVASTATVVALVLLFVVGQSASVVLPARRGRAVGVPTRSLVTGGAFAVVGMVVVPVVGIALGGALGVWLAERQRLDDADAATASTRAVLTGYGIGVLVEFGAGVVMSVLWLGAVLL